MKLNEQIREHRKKVGLTQEQVANYLGVSTPAVNKWESGSTYPDITLLPALARLLKIDLNVLFSFHEELTDSEIQSFAVELTEASQSNGFEFAYEMAKEKIRQYPYCNHLIYSSANILDAALVLAPMKKDQKDEYEKQIIMWYKQVASCQEYPIKISAISILAKKFIKNGNCEMAEKLAEEIPDCNFDKTSFQINISMLEGAFGEAAILMEGKLLQDLLKLHSSMCSLIEIELKDGNCEMAEQITKIAQSMIPLFGLWPYLMRIPYLYIALYKKDVTASLNQIENIFESAKEITKMETSPLYYRMAQVPTNRKLIENAGNRFISAFVSEIENKTEYDFLRNSKKLQSLISEYHTVSTN